MILLIIIGCYIGCWVLIFGMLRADDEGDFPSQNQDSKRDTLGFITLFASMFACLGPIGLLTIFCITGFCKHGFKLIDRKPKTEVIPESATPQAADDRHWLDYKVGEWRNEPPQSKYVGFGPINTRIQATHKQKQDE